MPPGCSLPRPLLEALQDGLLEDRSWAQSIVFGITLETNTWLELDVVSDVTYPEGWRVHVIFLTHAPTFAADKRARKLCSATDAVADAQAVRWIFHGTLESPAVPASAARGLRAIVAIAELPLAVVVALQALEDRCIYAGAWNAGPEHALVAMPYGVGDPDRFFPNAYISLNDRFVALVPRRKDPNAK